MMQGFTYLLDNTLSKKGEPGYIRKVNGLYVAVDKVGNAIGNQAAERILGKRRRKEFLYLNVTGTIKVFGDMQIADKAIWGHRKTTWNWQGVCKNKGFECKKYHAGGWFNDMLLGKDCFCKVAKKGAGPGCEKRIYQSTTCTLYVGLKATICPGSDNPTKNECEACSRGYSQSQIHIVNGTDIAGEHANGPSCSTWFSYAQTMVQAKANVWRTELGLKQIAKCGKYLKKESSPIANDNKKTPPKAGSTDACRGRLACAGPASGWTQDYKSVSAFLANHVTEKPHGHRVRNPTVGWDKAFANASPLYSATSLSLNYTDVNFVQAHTRRRRVREEQLGQGHLGGKLRYP